jgi:nitrous oxide reductase accessory protein NosL
MIIERTNTCFPDRPHASDDSRERYVGINLIEYVGPSQLTVTSKCITTHVWLCTIREL